jgi:anti-sigma factor RsiW
MVSCRNCERYLSAFLDNELDVKECLDIQEHLRFCTACATRAEGERLLQRFLRQHGRVAPLSEDHKRRLIRQAMQPPPLPSWWVRVGAVQHVRDFVKGVAAAAVLLLAFGYLLTALRSDDVMQKYVNEASKAYLTYTTQHVPPEVESPDDTVVTQWFNNRMGYQFKVPCITDGTTQLLGGRLCRLLDRKSAALFYKRNGVDILLFAFKGDSTPPAAEPQVHAKDPALYIKNVDGRPVAMWQRDGVTYSIVGDLPPDELLRLVATVKYR